MRRLLRGQDQAGALPAILTNLLVWRNGSRSSFKNCRLCACGFESLYQHQFMTPINFCYWLQGHFELADSDTLTAAQVQMIKRHLHLVFSNTPSPISASWTTCSVAPVATYWGTCSLASGASYCLTCSWSPDTLASLEK